MLVPWCFPRFKPSFQQVRIPGEDDLALAVEGCAKATASSSLLALREAKGASEGTLGSCGELGRVLGFTQKNSDLPIGNSDLPIENGDFTSQNGDFITKDCDFSNKILRFLMV